MDSIFLIYSKRIRLHHALEPGLNPKNTIIFRHQVHSDRSFPSQAPSFTDIRQAMSDNRVQLFPITNIRKATSDKNSKKQESRAKCCVYVLGRSKPGNIGSNSHQRIVISLLIEM